MIFSIILYILGMSLQASIVQLCAKESSFWVTLILSLLWPLFGIIYIGFLLTGSWEE